MSQAQGFVRLAGAVLGLGTGIVAEHTLVSRRRRNDPESGVNFGAAKGLRRRVLARPDGARLHIEEAGPPAGAGIVFLHGSALSTAVWHYQMSGVRGHRCVFFDLRGHGRSQPRGVAPFRVPTLASDLRAVIRDAGLHTVLIVGHSLGGMTALQLLVEEKERLPGVRLAGLLLASSTYGPAAETLVGGAVIARAERLVRRPFDMLGAQSARLDGLRRLAKASDALFWSVAFAAFGPRPSAKQVDLVYNLLASTPADVIFDLLRCFRAFDLRNRLEEIEAPALVLAGSHDRLTIPEAGHYLAEHLRQARLVVFDECGHLPMLERHDEFNRLLGDFADDSLGKARRETAAG
jgi:pimeloyl-ACP methyl ester carboxylesterase